MGYLNGHGIKHQYDKTSDLYQEESIDINSTSINEFEQMMLHPSDVITGVNFVSHPENYSTKYGNGKDGLKLQRIPFENGYQTSDEVCFTRSLTDAIGVKRMYDLLSLDKALLTAGSHFELELRIVLHYPDQLLRSFDNPSFRSTLAAYDKKKILEL